LSKILGLRVWKHFKINFALDEALEQTLSICGPKFMYVILSCEDLRAGAGSLCIYIDCCGLFTIVIKNVIIIIAR